MFFTRMLHRCSVCNTSSGVLLSLLLCPLRIFLLFKALPSNPARKRLFPLWMDCLQSIPAPLPETSHISWNWHFFCQKFVFKILFGRSFHLVFTGLVRKSAAALSYSLTLPARLLILSPGADKEKQHSLGGVQTVYPKFKLSIQIAMSFFFFNTVSLT